MLHADRLVQPNRGHVLGANEEADGRNPLEQPPAEVAKTARTVPLSPSRRVDPHLLELDRRGRPRGRLGLEEDDAVLDPEPRAPFFDLLACAPAEPLRVSPQGVDSELLLVCRRAGREKELKIVERRGPQSGRICRRHLPEDEHRLPGAILARPRKAGACAVPELRHRARLADEHPWRDTYDLAGEGAAPAPRGDGIDADVAEREELPSVRESHEPTEPAPRDVFEEDALDRILRAEAKDLVPLRLDEFPAHSGNSREGSRPLFEPVSRRLPAVPIHLRAEPGDYAEACLLPGDPLRAKCIAETFLTDVVQVNSERGLLGFTGRWEGKPVSVQGTGMGCPSATIVFEELIQLGVERLLRVGTCGGLQPDHALGDLIVAISAVPADATATHLVGGEPHCPTASWELVHEAVHVAKHSDQVLRVGPIVSSDLFYNPDEGQYERWSKRGILAVEMEAAALFTLAALRGVHGGCLLTVSDIVVEGEFVRISDDELREAVDRMTRIALDTATAQ